MAPSRELKGNNMPEEEYISGEEYQARGGRSPRKQVTISANHIGLLALVVVLCGLSFYSGQQYQKHHPKTIIATGPSTRAFGPNGFEGPRGRMGNIGQVTAVSDTSITVQNERSGDSTTYAVTTSTTISKDGSTATASDIKTGDTVLIEASSSDTKTATRILINPSFGGGPTQQQGSSSSPDSAQSN
jgi:hypothetical protein